MINALKPVTAAILTLILLTYLSCSPGAYNTPLEKTGSPSSSGWNYVGQNAVYFSQADSLTIAFDNSGNPYVCFIDEENADLSTWETTNCVTMLKYSSSSGLWQAIGSPDFSPPGSSYASMALYNNTPYAAFSDGTNGGKVSVMTFNGSAWVYIGYGLSAGQASYISLAADSTGTLYVAFSDAGEGNRARVCKYSGSGETWTSLSDTGFSSGEAGWTSLAIGPGRVPYVVFEDQANNNGATVMYYSGGTNWTGLGPCDFSAGKAAYTGIVFYNGAPYVIYSDGAMSGKASVMTVQFRGMVLCRELGIYPGNGRLSIHGDRPEQRLYLRGIFRLEHYRSFRSGDDIQQFVLGLL